MGDRALSGGTVAGLILGAVFGAASAYGVLTATERNDQPQVIVVSTPACESLASASLDPLQGTLRSTAYGGNLPLFQVDMKELEEELLASLAEACMKSAASPR